MDITPTTRAALRLHFAQIARARGVDWVRSVLRPLGLHDDATVQLGSIPDRALVAIVQNWGFGVACAQPHP